MIILDSQLPTLMGTKDITIGEVTFDDMPTYLNAVNMVGESGGEKVYEWTAYTDIGLGPDNYIWYYGWNRDGEYEWAVTNGDPEDAVKILLGI